MLPRLHQLKQKLLHTALKETDDAVLFKHLCGAANAAAELAWDTACPLLAFPCLFEEMAQAVRTHFQREPLQCSDGESLSPFEQIDPEFGCVDPNSGRFNPLPSIEFPAALFTPQAT